MPDPVLLGFSSLPEAPRCPEVRADFARLCIARFAMNRGYNRLALVVLSSSIAQLKSIFIGFNLTRADDSPSASDPAIYNQDGFYNGGMALAVRDDAHLDLEFLRLLELASDIVDWDSDGDAEYIAKAWPVLCDEIEYETEHTSYRDEYGRVHFVEHDDDCPSPWYTIYRRHSRRDLLRMQRAEKRY